MMKTTFLLMGIIFLGLLSCKENNSKTSETPNSTQISEDTFKIASDFLISESAVGPFEIGGSLPQNDSKYQVQKIDQVRYTDDGTLTETAYILSQNGTKHLVLKPRSAENSGAKNQQLNEIFVWSEQYKTAENIGVNSTLKAFAEAYPDFKIWYTYVSDRYVLENAVSSIQFLLNEKDFKGEVKIDGVKVPLKRTDFSEGAKIEKIRVYQSSK